MIRSSFLPRVATAVVIAAFGISTLAPFAAPTFARTGEASSARLDLAVGLPVSSSLADAGFADYGWVYMDTPVADDFFVDFGDDPAYTKAVQKTGYMTGQSKMWQSTATMGTPAEDDQSTFIVSAIYQFETEEGASDAMALVTSDDPGAMPDDYEEHAIDLGDESTYSSFSFDGNGDVLIHSILVREGDLVGDVSVFYGDDFSTDPGDQEDAALDVAAMIDDGLQDVLSGDTPNLSQLAPVYDDGGLLDFTDYLYRDDALMELYPGETAAMAQDREQGYVDDNAVAVYRVIQPIIADAETVPHYGASTTFTSFATSRDAKAWLADRPDVLETSSGVVDVRPVDLDADSLPDGIAAKDVSAFTYTMDFGDDEPYYKIQVNVRVGELGFTTYLESPVATPSEEALMAIVSDITTGIDEGGCEPIMEVPAATQADADALAEQAS